MSEEQKLLLSQIQSAAIENGWKVRMDKLIRMFREQRVMLGHGESDWLEDVDAFIGWLRGRFGVSRQSYNVYRRRFAGYALLLGSPSASALIDSSEFKPASSTSFVVGSRGEKVKVKSDAKKAKLKKKRANESVLSRYENFAGSAGYKSGLLSGEDVSAFLIHANAEFRNGKRRYKDGALVGGLIELGAMTGIRPIEWFDTELVDSLSMGNGDVHKDVLVVQGAAKGRGEFIGKQRHLSIGHWTNDEKDRLRYMIELVDFIKGEFVGAGGGGVDGDGDSATGRDGVSSPLGDRSIGEAGIGSDGGNDDAGRSMALMAYKKELTRLSGACQTVCKAAFGQEGVITLYTGRHLYAAEFRRGKVGDRIMLAAALGHTDIMNQRYYGDHFESDEEREFGWSLAKPLDIDAQSIALRVTARRAKKKQLLIKYLLEQGLVDKAKTLGYVGDGLTDTSGVESNGPGKDRGVDVLDYV